MATLGPTQRNVLLWDEIPFLLENIFKREGAKFAMEVLDILRALGQDHDRIRLSDCFNIDGRTLRQFQYEMRINVFADLHDNDLPRSEADLLRVCFKNRLKHPR